MTRIARLARVWSVISATQKLPKLRQLEL